MMVVLDPQGAEGDWGDHLAVACTVELGMSLVQVQCLLAPRAFATSDYDGESGDSPEPEAFSSCSAGRRR
ncbi:hypothetical protein GCM10027089_63610 [Nocardia thraciensis]